MTEATARSLFGPAGVMSIRDACLIVFRGMKPGDWSSEADVVAQVRELTETECSRSSVQSGAWSARETLAQQREVGVEAYMGGYKRLDAMGQVNAVDRRVRRTRRGLRRVLSWAGAALENPALPAEHRNRLLEVERATLMQSELDARRAQRRRPLGPGEPAT